MEAVDAAGVSEVEVEATEIENLKSRAFRNGRQVLAGKSRNC